MTVPRNVLPRSPAGLLAGPNGVQEDLMSRSPSGHSTASGSSHNRPGIQRRRSTDASLSGGIDNYYFSRDAGVKGINSSSSSLAISPSPSGRALSPLPLLLQKSRSHSSLDYRAKQDIQRPPLHQHPSNHSAHSDQDPGPSNRRIHIISYPSSGSVPGLEDGTTAASPGGWSASSDYSNPESAPSRINGIRTDSLETETSDYSPVDYRDMYGGQRGETKRGLLEPSTVDDEWDRRNDGAREGMASGAAYRDRGEQGDDPNDLVNRTPMPPAHTERLIPHPQRPQYPRQATSPSLSDASGKQITPTRARFPKSSSSTVSGCTPSSGRLAFVAPSDVSRQSNDDLEREVEAQGSDRMDMRVTEQDEIYTTAPLIQNEFGGLAADEDEDDDTLRGRDRRTLPATTSTSSGAIVESMLSPDGENMLSPNRYEQHTSRRSSESGRSPEPPPRSILRPHITSSPPPDSQSYIAISPLRFSPNPSHDALPTIINTAYSPDPSPVRPVTSPYRPSRSPDRTPSFETSATINDLTEMLGGAIDAIGLIDSRDTPPPGITEPRKDKPNLMLGPFASAAELADVGPITPRSLPQRSESLLESEAGGPPTATHQPTQNGSLHKVSSVVSLKSTLVQSPTRTNIATRPWPAAMLYGHVKTMKNSSDRAKGYARSINELAKAETGLREWCIASAAQTNRSAGHAPSKTYHAATLGVRSQSFVSQSSQASLTIPQPTSHARRVSNSSEFPMRADSYSAREISQRVIDPSDQPTSLPPNLPYPQLQQQLQSGMKQSQSMQSMASSTAKKGGFFSHMGRKGGKKESVSLGPPGQAAKKDVRGLSISGPRSTSPQSVIEGGGLAAPRVQPSISPPMGPRGPRLGSYTPPPSTNLDRSSTEIPGRASLDTGLSRISTNHSQARTSLDGSRSGKSSIPARSSPMAAPKEEDVRGMADVLPQVEKGILRAYLGRYGDQMQAIGAYLEDVNKGRVMRV